jgi:hypothetical protein
VNHTDYAWFEHTQLAYAYCLTLVKNIEPSEALRRIAADNLQRISGLPALTDYCYGQVSFNGPSRWGIGAVQLDGGSLLVEPNGFLGTRPEIAKLLSQGTELASHYRNVDHDGSFLWVRDGEILVDFEPMFPYGRRGTTPDALVELMTRIGFDLSTGPDRSYDHYTEKAMALAGHLTGLVITPETLASADYLCGLVDPPG